MKYWRHADCLKQYRHCAYPLVGLKEGKIIFVITITESVGLFWKKDMGLCVGRQPLVIEPSAARTAAAASSVVLQLQMRTSQTGHQVLTAIPVRRTKPAEQLPFRAVDANHSRSARVRGSCGSTSLGSSSLVQQSAVETSLSVEEEEEEGGRPRSCSCQSIGIKVSPSISPGSGPSSSSPSSHLGSTAESLGRSHSAVPPQSTPSPHLGTGEKPRSILKQRSNSLVNCPSPARLRTESFLVSARENTLNFFNPRRRFDARRRILENTAHFWNNDDDADGTNAARNGQDSTVNYLDAYSANSFNSRMVHFELDQVLPSLSSKYHRRNSLDSTTGELSVQAIPCSTPVKSSLPSLHMRQWHKLANVVGVAIGLGAISSKKKSSSDPEITTMTSPELDRGSQSQSLMSEEDGMTTSSSFSGLYGLTDDLDFDLASTLSFDSRMASIPSRRRVRKNSETQSEYILEASAKLRQQRFLREDCDCDNTTPVVPAIDIIVPSSPSLTSSHSSSSDKVLEV